MATVYLAQDLKHHRKVAVKVLRPELAAVIGAQRFLQEITTTASLQHPHILALHDSGTVDGTVFYVMPFVEGETLRTRLAREKQLPVDEAIRIAREVAAALDYAHRHGVIHRDIKPENILLHDRAAMVADFGIALAATTAGGGRMTETGMSLGTPTYMSPEQAMGERSIDARTDVYALGCVLYEMLAGEPPFNGPTAQAILAKVMTADPVRLTDLRKTVPPHVEAAVFTALAKLPADRFAGASEFAEALGNKTLTLPSGTTAARPSLAPAASSRSRLRDPLVLGLTVATVASLLALLVFRRPAAAPSFGAIRFLFTGNDSAQVSDNYPWPAAISPDGATLVYAVEDRSNGWNLYSRHLDQIEGHPIPGTGGGSQAVFSPDGQWLTFESGGKERKVRLDGSAPVTIADGGAANGADWTVTDELVVGATSKAHGLSRVSVAGGQLAQFTRPDSSKGELDHLWPVAFPDGRSVVFMVWYGSLATAQLATASLNGGPVSLLDLKGVRPLAVLDGALVYLQADGSVMAVSLDPSGKRVKGRPIPVLDPVTVLAANNGNSSIFISRGGALVTGLGTHRGQLTWLGRDGVSRPISREVHEYYQPRLSPDGRRIAALLSDGSRSDVWIHDLETGTLSRLTNVETVTSVEWARDGKRVVYSAGGSDKDKIWAQSVEVASAPEKLADLPYLTPLADLSTDGHSLVVQSLVDNGWDVLRVVLDSGGAIRPFSASKDNDVIPRFSPDGHLVAVVTNESGNFEVYIRSFPVPTAKVQVSVGGGSSPVWSADGTRLYYLSGNVIVEARLATSGGVRVVSRDTAFTQVRGGGGGFGQANFDVTRDGSRIVIPASQSQAYQLIVVPNWITEFRAKMAASKK